MQTEEGKSPVFEPGKARKEKGSESQKLHIFTASTQTIRERIGLKH